jgi:hypothetical protein
MICASGCLFTKDLTTTIKFCKHCHAFMLCQSYILKWSKLIIPACNKTSILTWGLLAFSWVYRRNEILIVVVRSFVNRYPGHWFWMQIKFSVYLAVLTDFDCGLFRSSRLDALGLTTGVWGGTRSSCDRSAGDAHTSAAPDSTSAFVGGLCWSTLDL